MMSGNAKSGAWIGRRLRDGATFRVEANRFASPKEATSTAGEETKSPRLNKVRPFVTISPYSHRPVGERLWCTAMDVKPDGGIVMIVVSGRDVYRGYISNLSQGPGHQVVRHPVTNEDICDLEDIILDTIHHVAEQEAK